MMPNVRVSSTRSWICGALAIACALSVGMVVAHAQVASTISAPVMTDSTASGGLLLHASPQDEHVFLTWNEEAGATYSVRWKLRSDREWDSLPSLQANYAVVDDLRNGELYQFQVVASLPSGVQLRSRILGEVPRARDDCFTTGSIFCSVPAMQEWAQVNFVDLTNLRCREEVAPPLSKASRNCRYFSSERVMSLNRSFGGVFRAPDAIADPAVVRRALNQVIWKGHENPLTGPGSLLGRFREAFPNLVGNVDVSDSLERRLAVGGEQRDPITRSLVMRVHDGIYSRLTWFSYPDHIPGRYAIYHEGHGAAAIQHAAPLINWLLAAGWQVLALDTVLEGLNGLDSAMPIIDHDDLQRAVGMEENPWPIFFLPVAAAVDLAYEDAKRDSVPVQLMAIGRSTGAWTSMLYGAMDPRVKVAVNISGAAPHSTFNDTSAFRRGASHFENDTPALYDQVSLDEAVLAAGTRGSFHFYSSEDPCCYRFLPSHPWIRYVSSLRGRKDKNYRVHVGNHPEHGMNEQGHAMLGRFLTEVGLPPRPKSPASIAAAARADSLKNFTIVRSSDGSTRLVPRPRPDPTTTRADSATSRPPARRPR